VSRAAETRLAAFPVATMGESYAERRRQGVLPAANHLEVAVTWE
jgi:hypothetical protein